MMMSGSAEEESWTLVEDRGVLLMDDDYADFPVDFKNYVKSKLKCRRLKRFSSFVFWSEDDTDADADDLEFESSPIHSFCGIRNSVPATLLDNRRIKEKIRSVIQKVIIESDGSVLIQFWAPRTVGDRCVLTTADQPFGLSLIDGGLCEFRRISMKYKFYVDAKSADDPAVLGHVFRQTVVACAPDVKDYSSEEYPQRCDAVNSHVRTSLAFPVIDPSSRCCVGVLELLATASIYSSHHLAAKLQYEIQDLGLKYSDAYGHDFTPVDQVLEEISIGVKVVCETHKLPLVQTWVPCRCCISVELGDSCSRCYTSCKGQVMTSHHHMKASYAFDEATSGFLFSMNYLLKGQGVAGRALSSYSPCFCRDVTRFSFTEYPLVHLARIFGLTSCFAICLRSTYTGDADYVIEFFLPLNSEDGCDPMPLLDSILATMKQHFQSFKVASGEELGQGLSVEVIKFSQDKSGDSFQICQTSRSTPRLNVEGMVQLDSSNQQLVVEAIAMNNGRNVIGQEQSNGDVIYFEKNGSVRTLERENKKTEISISYEDLEPHFGKNLNDVAENLGVSRSTLKRICRNLGITRWSCRKRKKRNGGTDFCIGHGGGKRCVSLGCTKSAHGRADCCVTHGGGKHCRFENCGKSAQGSTDFCKAHGEGKRCNWGEEICEKFARGKSGLCAAHSSMFQERQTNKGGKQVNESVQRAKGAASLTFAFPVLGALASAETEEPLWEPLWEKSIENKGTLHYFRNLCPTTAEAECHQGLEFELDEAATSMALALVPDAEIPARSPKASIGVAFTQSSGNSHDFRNLSPSAVKACRQDSEQEFRLAIASLPANSLSVHVSSQPGTPSGGMLMQNVVSSKHTEKCSLATTQDACLNEEIARKEAYTKPCDTAMQGANTVTVKARYGNGITIKFRLSLSSGLVELRQEVAKRLNLEGGTYYIKYKDEEEELILIACNEDLQEYIDTSRSLGKTSIVVLLEPK